MGALRAGVDADPAFLARVWASSSIARVTTEDESDARARGAESAADPLGAVLAARLERGFAPLVRRHSDGPPPTILVLRSAPARQPGGLDLQIAAALSALHKRLMRGEEAGPLVILAHAELTTRLKSLLSACGPVLGPVVRWVDDDPDATVAAQRGARVEIVDAGALIDALDTPLRPVLQSTQHFKPDPAAAKPTGSQLQAGQLFHGKYRIVRRIGGGGFGDVYEARDERGVKNRVAIKVLRSDASTLGAQQLEDFRDEARRLTRLDHANIVNWKSFDEADDGTLYLVMEFVEGEELSHLLAREKRLAPKRVERILLQILDALRAAHNVGDGESILHLDLKPQNAFVVKARGEEQIKLIDFGIGQHIGGDATPGPRPTAVAEAQASRVQGTISLGLSFQPAGETSGVRRVAACTPEFAAPEHCRHVLGHASIVALDGRADLFSVGVMAFQMLSGRMPYADDGFSRYDIVCRHADTDAMKVSDCGTRVPRDLARFVDKLLARDRDQRWKSADEAWRALDEIVHPPAWKAALRVSVVLLVLGGLAAWAFWPDDRVSVKLAGVTAAGAVEDLAGRPLHLGPKQRTARIRLAAQGADWVRHHGVPIGLIDGNGAPLPAGWSVRWATDGPPSDVEIEYTGDEAGRYASNAKLSGDLGSLWLQGESFQLVWLGASAWSIQALRIGEATLVPERALRVDPEGLELTVELGGSGLKKDDLAADVTWNFGAGTDPLRSATSLDARGILVSSVQLPWPWKFPEEVRVGVRVSDRAGAEHEESRSLRAETRPLVATALLVDEAGAGSAAPTECRRLTQGYLLTPRAAPVLVVSFDRVALPALGINVNGSPLALATPPVRTDGDSSSGPGLAYRIDLRGLIARLSGGETGTLELSGNDVGVLRASGGARGRCESSFKFSFSKDTARIEVDAGGRQRSDGDVWFTNAEVIALTLRSDSDVPVVVRWRVRGPDASASTDWQDLTGQLQSVIGSLRAEKVDVNARVEGRYQVDLEAYQTSGAEMARSEQPDSKSTIAWVVARHPPRVAWSGLTDGAVLKSAAELAAQLALGTESAGSGAPLGACRWRLEEERASSWSERGSGDLGARSSLSIADILPAGAERDGRFRLVASGVDAAGNALEERTLGLQVSLHGPLFEKPSRPAASATWERDADKQAWRVQVRLEDPNGIDTSSMSVTVADAAAGSELKPVTAELRTTADTAAGTSAVVAEGLVPLGEEWSRRTVKLTLRARDALGDSGESSVTGIRVGDTSIALPDRLVALPGRPACLTLRRVVGNAGSVYVFGGQGDEAENDLFRRAGLAPFDTDRGEKSFQVGYADGAVADFYLDEDEVSRGEFFLFVRAADGYFERSHWPAGSARDVERETLWKAQARIGATPDLPVTDVTWDEAAAYAHWCGKRLPSLVEWEYAVRDGSRSYRPYAAFDPARSSSGVPRLNCSGISGAASEGAPWPRGLGADVSPEGLRNLCGNVREWTATPHGIPGDTEPDPKRLATAHSDVWLDPARLGTRLGQVREFYAAGGWWGSKHFDFLTWSAVERREAQAHVGFRCALSGQDARRGLGSKWGAGS